MSANEPVTKPPLPMPRRPSSTVRKAAEAAAWAGHQAKLKQEAADRRRARLDATQAEERGAGSSSAR